jgi:hypothetical protein
MEPNLNGGWFLIWGFIQCWLRFQRALSRRALGREASTDYAEKFREFGEEVNMWWEYNSKGGVLRNGG